MVKPKYTFKGVVSAHTMPAARKKAQKILGSIDMGYDRLFVIEVGSHVEELPLRLNTIGAGRTTEPDSYLMPERPPLPSPPPKQAETRLSAVKGMTVLPCTYKTAVFDGF